MYMRYFKFSYTGHLEQAFPIDQKLLELHVALVFNKMNEIR